MKSHILLLAGILIVFSCNNEGAMPDIAKSDRLKFPDIDAYFDTYRALATLGTVDHLKQWAAARDHSTVLDSEDEQIVNRSEYLKTILNKDFEFQVGDDIIWFNEGTLYSIPKAQEAQIAELKKKPEDLTKYGTISFIPVSAAADNGRTQVMMGFGGTDARNQKTFGQQTYQVCGGTSRADVGTRKYVHEVYDETHTILNTPQGPRKRSSLYLRIKLEYYSSGWKPASEQRYVDLNVSGSATITGSGIGNIPIYASGTQYCLGSNWSILMLWVEHGPIYTLDPGIDPKWIFSLDGYIYHYINGDNPANAWNNDHWEDVQNEPMLWPN